MLKLMFRKLYFPLPAPPILYHDRSTNTNLSGQDPLQPPHIIAGWLGSAPQSQQQPQTASLSTSMFL